MYFPDNYISKLYLFAQRKAHTHKIKKAKNKVKSMKNRLNWPVFLQLITVATIGIMTGFMLSSVTNTGIINDTYACGWGGCSTDNQNVPEYWCGDYDGGVKFDPAEDATLDGITADFSRYGKSVDLSAIEGKEITFAVVKAQNRATYDSEPWTGLTAPDNKEISHVIVCYDEVEVPQYGNIVVDKEVAAGSSTSTSFTFQTTGDGFDGFTLSASDEPHDSGDLNPGDYSVYEVNPDGWEFQSVVCESSFGGTEDAADIQLEAGETVTCTFTNKEEEVVKPTLGSITVCKLAVDKDSNIIDGAGHDGTFSIASLEVTDHPTVPDSTALLPTSAFNTPLTLNSDLIGDSENDAECVTYDNLELGSYYYDQEEITGDNWSLVGYNDQYSSKLVDLSGFYPYSGELFTATTTDDESRNLNSDGHITLTEARPDRTLVVLNKFTASSTCPYCGDGIVNQDWEECDGSAPDGYTCTPGCKLEQNQGPYCGNGILEEGEECDGRAPDGYTCSDTCELEPETPNYGPYCGDGIVNQDWEQCEPIEGEVGCSQQCQFIGTPVCSDLVLAKINIDDVQNWGSGNTFSDLYIGGNTPIPAGVWFLVHQNGTYADDPDIASYEDVPGLAVQRMEGKILTVMHGSGSGDDKEHVDGNVEFWSWDGSVTATRQINDSTNGLGKSNKLENGFDGTGVGQYNAGNDEVSNDSEAKFWLTTTTADDGFYTEYSDIPVCETPKGTLKVIKVVINDSGTGSATTTDFNLYVDSTQVYSGDVNEFDAGDYVVSESGGPGGYTATFSGDCDAQGNVTVVAGESKTCTITNDDNPGGGGGPDYGKIVIIKDAQPNSEQDFSFSGDLGTFQLDDDADATLSNKATFDDLDEGTYTVTEDATTGWTLTGVTCSVSAGGDSTWELTDDGVNISVLENETVTCTFTNTQDEQPYGEIHGTKYNNANELGLEGWAIELYKNDQLFATTTTDADGNYQFTGLDDGDSVCEVPQDGWDQVLPVSSTSTVDCSNGTVGYAQALSSDTVAEGLDFWNEHQSEETGAQIIIKKLTDSPGSEQFEFQVSWTSDSIFVGHNSQVESGDLAPGTYSVNEVNLPGTWKLDSVGCKSSFGGSEDHDAISLQEGETVTCTFSNVEETGGGGGITHGGGGSSHEPEGEILAAQTNLIPLGAPDTGFVGMTAVVMQIVFGALIALLGLMGFAVAQKRA